MKFTSLFVVIALLSCTSFLQAKSVADTLSREVMIVLSLDTEDMNLLDEQLTRIDTESFTFWKIQATTDGKKTIKVKINPNVAMDGLAPTAISNVTLVSCPNELKRHRLVDVDGIIDIQIRTEEDFWSLVTLPDETIGMR